MTSLSANQIATTIKPTISNQSS